MPHNLVIFLIVFAVFHEGTDFNSAQTVTQPVARATLLVASHNNFDSFCSNDLSDSSINKVVSILKEDPNNEELRLHLASLYVGRGETANALSQLEICINHDQHDCLAYELKADILESMGRYEEAVESLTTCINLGTPIIAHSRRGGIYAGQKNYRKAIADFSWAIEHEAAPGGDAFAKYVEPYRIQRGDCWYKLGNYRKALVDYQVESNNEPVPKDLFEKIADCERRLGK